MSEEDFLQARFPDPELAGLGQGQGSIGFIYQAAMCKKGPIDWTMGAGMRE
jgi:hypothetical protein